MNLVGTQRDELSTAGRSIPSGKIWWVAYLGLLTILSWFYQIEANLGLPKIMLATWIGFTLLPSIPVKYRQWLFPMLGIGTTILLFSWEVAGFLVLLSLSTLFLLLNISKTHWKVIVPISLMLSILLVRVFIPIPEDLLTATVIYGGLFMFRLFSFLLNTQFKSAEHNGNDVLGYFFLLPNFIFPIFPIVDFGTYIRSRTELQFDLALVRKGMTWIGLGLIYLIIYRVLYYFILPNKLEIQNVLELILFHVVNYLLVIRLAGIFVLSCGIVCLSGHDLPRIFNNMFLSTSFTDLWRRLNIYWRDFLMSFVYYPIYFKLRKRIASSITFSILIVFVVNYFMHSYQWLWILGDYPIRTNDILFWMGFGVLVTVNSLWDISNNSKTGSNQSGTWMSKTLQTFLVFSFMCLAWAFWTEDSIADWLDLWVLSGEIEVIHAFKMTSLVFCVLACFAIGHIIESRGFLDKGSSVYLVLSQKVLPALIGMLVLLAVPVTKDKLIKLASVDLEGFYEQKLNAYDEKRMFRGYYESILSNTSMTGQLMGKERKRPKGWLKLKDLGIRNQDPRSGLVALTPDTQVVYKEAVMTINSLGLRDKEYTQSKRSDIYRIALIGGSNELGSGVADDETFENIAETLLNQRLSDSVEILNFSITGLHLPDQIARYQLLVRSFDPDMIIYPSHFGEAEKNIKSFMDFQRNPEWLKAIPILQEVYERYDLLGEGLSKNLLYKRFLQDKEALATEVIADLDAMVRGDSAKFRVLLLPNAEQTSPGKEDELFMKSLRELDLEIFDLSGTFEHKAKDDLILAEWDFHYNSKAHRLIGEELYRLILDEAEQLDLQ